MKVIGYESRYGRIDQEILEAKNMINLKLKEISKLQENLSTTTQKYNNLLEKYETVVDSLEKKRQKKQVYKKKVHELESEIFESTEEYEKKSIHW